MHFNFFILPSPTHNTSDRKWTGVRELGLDKANETVLVRTRVHNRRGAGGCGCLLSTVCAWSMTSGFPDFDWVKSLLLDPLPPPRQNLDRLLLITSLGYPANLNYSYTSQDYALGYTINLKFWRDHGLWLFVIAPAGKLCFLMLRQQYHTVQAVVSVSEKVSKQMVRFASE